MQKLNMIDAFIQLDEGTDATFAHPDGQADQSRLIKMRINSPQPVNLYVTRIDIDAETGEVTHVEEGTKFLAHISAGFEQIEFYYRGSFCLSALGGSIWLDTYDNTAFSVEASDFTNYARLWEREERDPRILEIERAARHNQEMLLRQMAEDRAAYMAQFEAMAQQVKSNVNASSTPANSGTSSDESQVSASTSASDPQSDTSAEAGTGGAQDAAT